MAVTFRHGSNGSYKTAYIVWHVIVPALKAGRVVVTNVEGLKPLPEIAQTLGIEFPKTARICRIYSRNEKGIHLWQHWFCWMPIGALVVIDECQDIFTKHAGFVMEKVKYQAPETFYEDLPDYWPQLFLSAWKPVSIETQTAQDTDDTGRTEYNDKQQLLYPDTFYGAFMRHRKYSWDIHMLTPDWTSIPTNLRGCAGAAYAHKSTDNPLTNFRRHRTPRVYSHATTATSTKPPAKSPDITFPKVPLKVFQLYRSTGTGKHTQTMMDVSALKGPKFIFSIFLIIFCIGYFIHVLFKPSEEDVSIQDSATDSVVVTESAQDSLSVPTDSDTPETTVKGGILAAHDVSQNTHYLFAGAESVYLTATVRQKILGLDSFFYSFRVTTQNAVFSINSDDLHALDISISPLTDCLVRLYYQGGDLLVGCPPRREIKQEAAKQVELQNVVPIPTFSSG